MERCLDCNSVMMSKEKVCPLCGTKIVTSALGPAELAARAGTIIFYSAVLTLLVSRFTPEAAGFVPVLCACAAIVMFAMRRKLFTR